MDRTLEALALASLDTDILIKRLASVWCQHYGNSAPTSGDDILDWVAEEFGDVVKKSQRRIMRLALGREVRRQLTVRRRRRELRAPRDVLAFEFGAPERTRWLLDRILGPPRRWVSPNRTGLGTYNNYCITSGLVAAIIPTNIRLRSLKSPSILVYRQPGDKARSHWIPGDVTTLDYALVWLIPEKAHRLIKMDGVRVKHDGRLKRVSVVFPDGTEKTFAWRKVREG